MKRLLGLLLVMVGCGGPTLEQLATKIGRNDNGEIISVDFKSSNVTDAGLVQLKDLPNLEWLGLGGTKLTDAGLVHLKEIPPATRQLTIRCFRARIPLRWCKPWCKLPRPVY
jgi:hypothetical protein